MGAFYSFPHSLTAFLSMNRFCERCERITQDGNLWCPEKDCPAEEGYPVLVYGEHLGDLKVTKLVRVWRTAALYEAQRGEQSVLLKVAHSDDECEERLKREAVALQSLAPRKSFLDAYRAAPRPILPVPAAPYPTPSKRPYGEISFRGETKVFSVFQHAKGKILSDLLLENPQVWHYQAAWVVITLADAIRPLAANNKSHLSLTPDVILVDTDPDGNLRPMLLDLGFLLEGNEIESMAEWPRLNEPVYTAPELLTPRPRAVNPTADVYSLGMIFYQMLAGQPGFEPKLYRDERVREAVMQNRKPLAVGRPELEQAGVVKIVERALAPSGRFNNVLEMAGALKAIYGAPPPEKRPAPSRLYWLIGILAVILLGVAGVAGYVLLQVMMSNAR
jgi:serine/threonine protein kinase